MASVMIVKLIRLLLLKAHKVFFRVHDFKAFYYSFLFGSCGDELKFFGPCNIKNPQNVSVGNNVTINDGVYINGVGGVEIGDNVSISASAIIVSTGLDPSSMVSKKSHIEGPIIIGNNVQIGAGAIVIAGVTVGDNVIVGAGSVVTKDVSSNCIVCGVPARYLRSL